MSARSKAHARRGHKCEFCGTVAFGNGGNVSHQRKHVRAGEAVELVRWYGGVMSTSRLFIPADDGERIDGFINRGFRRVSS